MWNKLRARHFTILILAVIVMLETSAIAIDRFLAKNDNTAFQVVGQFKNNIYMDKFQAAEAKSQPIPASLAKFSTGMARPAVPTFSQDKNFKIVRISAETTPKGKEPVAAVAVPEPETWTSYTIQKGDSLAAVAGLFNASSEAIAGLNKVKAASLKTGQLLRVPVTSEKIVYAVKSGDTLSRIASRFGLKVKDLQDANHMQKDFLVDGQKMTIPVKVQGKPLVMVKSAPAPTTAAVNTTELKKIAPPQPMIIQTAAPLQIVAAPAAKPSLKIVAQELPRPIEKVDVAKAAVKPAEKPVAIQEKPVEKQIAAVKTETAMDNQVRLVCHTVKSGESLSVLAQKYRTSIASIQTHNSGMTKTIRAGEKVQIPVSKKYYRVLQVKTRREEVSTPLRMPVSGRLSDPFGWRKHPVYRKRLFHAGIDLAAPRGTPIAAAAQGTVTYSGWMRGYGRLVVIKHASGLSTRYGHCSSIRVKSGQVVRKGQLIGTVGATGTATGNHLHFEVRRNGKPSNPLTFLR